MKQAGLIPTIGLASVMGAAASTGALAQQDFPPEKFQQFKEVALGCIDKWQERDCHTQLANLARAMVSDVTARLLVDLKMEDWANVTDQCAVASTYNWGDAKANDVANAYIYCVNAIYEAHKETGVPVDKDYYSFMTATSMVLQGNEDVQRDVEEILEKFLDEEKQETTQDSPALLKT